ncbi:hypothetical protein GY45DRAFT_1332443 [Cubamyces sp. BRFM 1775]|nr:hypothetical protein GY45DRAFT_1332443 [Cubamyces sp. BRFM 1775]
MLLVVVALQSLTHVHHGIARNLFSRCRSLVAVTFTVRLHSCADLPTRRLIATGALRMGTLPPPQANG